MKKSAIALTVASLLLAPAAAQTPPPISPAVYQPIAMESGVWDVAVTFFDTDGKPNGTAKGHQTNAMLPGGHWITNDLLVEGKPPFAGHGVWGYDPVQKMYVDTWVDTNDGAVRTDYGDYDPTSKTMYWTAAQPDGAGHMVTYRMTEQFSGNARTLTFFQIALHSGRLIKVAEFAFKRRA